MRHYSRLRDNLLIILEILHIYVANVRGKKVQKYSIYL